MKRILAMSLAMLLVLALAACGEAETGETAATQGETTAAPATEATEATPVETTAPETEPVETTEPPAFTIEAEILGSLNGTIYSNDMLGISVNLSESFVHYTDSEILAYNEIPETVTPEQLNIMAALTSTVAYNNDTESSFKLSVEQAPEHIVQAVSLTAYMNIRVKTVAEMVVASGASDVKTEGCLLEIDGMSVDGVLVQYKLNGLEYNATCFAYKYEGKLVFVEMHAASEMDAEEMINGISLHAFA